MHKVVNLILGGGFTGLELAARLPDAVILSEDIGGLISNFERGPFSFDLGGHVYTTADPRVKQLMEESGAQFHRTRKAFYRTRDQQYIPYPIQNHPDKLGIKFRPTPCEPENFDEYITSIFGSEFNRLFMAPFNRRVWSTPTEMMDFDWVRGRVKLPTEKAANWGMNASFYYALGSDIVSTMLQRIPDLESIYGSVTHIDTRNKIVTYSDDSRRRQHQVRYDNLFCTIPYFLPGLRRNRVLTIGIGLNKQWPEDFDWVYCDLRAYVHRVTLLSRYHKCCAPDGQDSLLLEIPYIDPRVGRYLPAELARVQRYGTHDDLVRTALRATDNAGFDVKPNDVAEVFVADTLGYPVPTVGSRAQVAATKQDLLYSDVYLAGRWGAHGYFNLQHVFADVDTVMTQFESRTKEVKDYLESSFYYAG